MPSRYPPSVDGTGTIHYYNTLAALVSGRLFEQTLCLKAHACTFRAVLNMQVSLTEHDCKELTNIAGLAMCHRSELHHAKLINLNAIMGTLSSRRRRWQKNPHMHACMVHGHYI